MQKGKKGVQGIYIDCSKYPYRSDHFLSLITLLQSNGYRYLLINFGEFFPWAEEFHFNTNYSYPEELINKIEERAYKFDIVVIPVLSIITGNDYIIKEKHYRHLVPEFPKVLQINPEAVGAVSLFEDMVLDIFSIFSRSPFLCVSFSEESTEKYEHILKKLSDTAGMMEKKILIEHAAAEINPDEFGNICQFYNAGEKKSEYWHEISYRIAVPDYHELDIIKIIPVFDFLPFSCIEKILKNSDVKECTKTLTLLKDFFELEEKCWKFYQTSARCLSELLLRNNSSSVITLLKEYKNLDNGLKMYKKAARYCVNVFSGDFEDEYIDIYFSSRTEPLEFAFENMSFQLRRIERRIS